MPGWYVHIQAAAETMEKLRAGVPPGSPLTQAEANALFTAAHDHRNYLAAGALGPDLFFLLPDFKGDVGKGLLALAEFVLTTWKAVDDTFGQQWDQWMAPVADNHSQLANSISGGMLGEISQVLDLLAGSLQVYVLGIAGQMVDVFGQLTSGTQTGYDDSAFFWSDAFHYRKTYQFARRLYANALKADVDIAHGGTSAKPKPRGEPSRVPKQQAFALGWMSHCATDVAAHPFTNAKCGGPYRTHWQRHKVIENHMDAAIYALRHPAGTNYDSIDTAALQFRLAFLKSATSPDPTMPDDEPSHDYFPPPLWMYPTYPEGETANEVRLRKETFDVGTERLPAHICELLIKTMQDVYSGPNDAAGPQVLKWNPAKTTGSGGRPSVAALQDMYDLAFTYARFSSSTLAPRRPIPPPVIGDHDLPRPPGLPSDAGGANPATARPITLLDILLAILAYALWIAQLVVWIATVLPSILTDLATWPLRALIYQLLLVPAWDLYMISRKPLVMAGYLSPKPSEISTGLILLGADEKGALTQLRADLDAPSGFASATNTAEPSGLDPTPIGPTGGYSLDPAYPRAMLLDRDPPWWDGAPIDASPVSSEFVAPWRYPSHNMAGMRNGWEAPRTHVGPYVRGQDVTVLMDGLPGSDAARRRFERATTPVETEAVSTELLTMPGQHLGDPVDYGAYLIGQLTGEWQSAKGYLSNDHLAPLPDFNLDSDRGYAYQCWDYMRHRPSTPPPNPAMALDRDWPDQWGCAPQIVSLLSQVSGTPADTLAARVRAWYLYQEPVTVPQKYDARDNPHHRSRYDPLKRLAHHYLARAAQPDPPLGWDRSDLQVSEAEMRAAGMSTTGRRPVR